MWCIIERVLELYRPAERKLLVAYVETGTNSYLKYIPEVLQSPLRVDNQNSKYNRLLCFMHD